jgi:UDP-N-acetyl-D-mannosaminuronic acid dehydrogenase
MTATAAEVTKTAENTFRDLQIAAVNQLALYCEAMGINVYDVLAGVGGHCLTKDIYHLERGCRCSAGNWTFRPAGNPSTPSPAGSTTSCPSTCSD